MTTVSKESAIYFDRYHRKQRATANLKAVAIFTLVAAAVVSGAVVAEASKSFGMKLMEDFERRETSPTPRPASPPVAHFRFDIG